MGTGRCHHVSRTTEGRSHIRVLGPGIVGPGRTQGPPWQCCGPAWCPRRPGPGGQAVSTRGEVSSTSRTVTWGMAALGSQCSVGSGRPPEGLCRELDGTRAHGSVRSGEPRPGVQRTGNSGPGGRRVGAGSTAVLGHHGPETRSRGHCSGRSGGLSAAQLAPGPSVHRWGRWADTGLRE